MATTRNDAKGLHAQRPATASTAIAAKAPPTARTKSTTGAKSATKAKTAMKVKALRAAVAKKPASERGKPPTKVSVDQRRNYIEMAAYYIAERRGFAPGSLLDDWVQAEAEIDRLLAEGRLGG